MGMINVFALCFFVKKIPTEVVLQREPAPDSIWRLAGTQIVLPNTNQKLVSD